MLVSPGFPDRGMRCRRFQTTPGRRRNHLESPGRRRNLWLEITSAVFSLFAPGLSGGSERSIGLFSGSRRNSLKKICCQIFSIPAQSLTTPPSTGLGLHVSKTPLLSVLASSPTKVSFLELPTTPGSERGRPTREGKTDLQQTILVIIGVPKKYLTGTQSP